MKITTPLERRRVLHRSHRERVATGATGLSWVLAAEVIAGALGFVALLHQARNLGPAAFARVEYAAAVAAWLLVLVRGGVDVIVYREAARRPRLIGPLTDLLIGLRCVAAVLGYCLLLLIGAAVGPDRGAAVAVAGLALFASVWVADVGPRATGRLGWIALAQGVRAAGFLAAVLLFVRGPEDALVAAGCLVLAEALSAAVPLALHCREYGFPRMRFRRRASLVLARRGAVTGLTRFARVSLYGADLLALGWWAGRELGSYAAARRVVFAMVGLGLVVPAALGPALARAWRLGPCATRERIAVALAGLWSASLPAAVGLGLTADRWVPTLFGAPYRDGGPWLALVAARLPWLLAASFSQAALVACRREDWSLRLVLGQTALAAVLIPACVLAAGPWGVAWATLVVEAAGAIAGWSMLARLGVAPCWTRQTGRAIVGCLGLIAGCRTTRDMPLAVVCLAGAIAYGACWRLASRWVRHVEATTS